MFRFKSGEPNQQLFNDVQNLNSFNDEQLSGFIEITLAFLANEASAKERVAEFADEHGVKKKALLNTIRGVLYFFNEALKQNMSAEYVMQDLVNLGLAEERASILSEKWRLSFTSLSHQMVLKTLAVNELVDMEWKFGVTASSKAVSKVGTCFLQLKLAIRRRRKNSTSTPGVTSDYAAFCRDFLSNKGTGTDEGGDSNDINTNTNTNTTVDAKTANASDDGLQHVLMELTLPQFYEFLQEMQKAGLQCGIGLGGGDTDAQIDTETGADEKRETGGIDNDTAMATETHTAGV